MEALILSIIISISIFIAICIWVIIILHRDEKRRKEEEIRKQEKYYRSEFYLQTNYRYEKVMSDPGIRGEYTMFSILDECVDNKFFVINCFCRTNSPQSMTEIDLVMFHRTGIYVFESKNWAGTIEGYTDSRTWMQKLGRDNNIKHEKYNPILQNRAHINAMMFTYQQALKRVQIMEVPLTYNMFVSIVVFNDKADVNIKRSGIGIIDSYCLTYYCILKDTITKYINKRPQVMTIQDVFSCFNFFNTISGPSKDRQMKKKEIEQYQEQHKHNYE